MASINAVTQAEIQAQSARLNRILLRHEVALRPRLRREIIRLWRRFGTLDTAIIEFEQNIQAILAREAQRTANDVSREMDSRLQESGSNSVRNAVLAGIALFIATRSQDSAREIAQTELENINDRARRLAQEGLTVREVAADLRDFAPSYSINRIELIAEVETARVADEVTQRSLDESGLEFTEKMWITAGDNRVRADHIAANNQRVAYNATFDVGGEALRYPRDPRGSAGNVIRCRCDAVYFTE